VASAGKTSICGYRREAYCFYITGAGLGKKGVAIDDPTGALGCWKKELGGREIQGSTNPVLGF